MTFIHGNGLAILRVARKGVASRFAALHSARTIDVDRVRIASAIMVVATFHRRAVYFELRIGMAIGGGTVRTGRFSLTERITAGITGRFRIATAADLNIRQAAVLIVVVFAVNRAASKFCHDR